MSSRTFHILLLAAVVPILGCGPTVRPTAPVVTCAPIAQGKIIHLAEVEDWRKDGLGPRDFGQARFYRAIGAACIGKQPDTTLRLQKIDDLLRRTNG